jgi:hypothetical protein
MNRIAAEVPQEVGVLFEHNNVHSSARQQKTGDHASGSPARDATTGLDNS